MGNCVPSSKKKFVPEGSFDPRTDVLHVITVIFNPAGFNSRVELYRRFAADIERKPNVVLWTVECLFPGQTTYSVTRSDHPRHIQLYAPHKIWLKENLINVAAGRLPPQWKYMAWVDGDLLFEGDDVAERTIRALGVNPVVQMWEKMRFLGPNGEVLEENWSFGYFYKNRTIDRGNFDKAYPHPGFAWAIRREAFDMLDGLPEFSIVGNGDNHFAYALIGRVRESVPEAARTYASPGYMYALQKLEERLIDMQRCLLQRSVSPRDAMGPGYARGVTVRHMWHGDWRDRGYVTRWQCFVVPGGVYDPYTDLQKYGNGVLMLRNEKYVGPIESYFTSRKEDSRQVVTDHLNKHENAAKLLPAHGGSRPHNPRRHHHRHSRRRHRSSSPPSVDSQDCEWYSAEEHTIHHHNDCDWDGYGHGTGGDCPDRYDGAGGGDGGCGGNGGGDVFSAAHSAYC